MDTFFFERRITMIVKVKGKGVKLSGKWCFKNEEAEIDEVEYEKNKEYVDIIKEDVKEPQIPQVPNNNDQDEEEIQLQELRTKAKALGIKNAHLMKKENLEKLIAEKENPLSDANDGKKSDNTDTKPDTTADGSDINDGTIDEGENSEENKKDNNEAEAKAGENPNPDGE